MCLLIQTARRRAQLFMFSTTRLVGRILFCALFVGLFFQKPAHAYLDPGSGSFFFQILLGALFSALFSLRLFWANIKNFVSRLGRKKSKTEDESNDQ